MEWKTVLQWENENKKEFPYFGSVWVYDAYGECWDCKLWKYAKAEIKNDRNIKEDNAYYAYSYEPMIADINLTTPRYGDGVRLKINET